MPKIQKGRTKKGSNSHPPATPKNKTRSASISPSPEDFDIPSTELGTRKPSKAWDIFGKVSFKTIHLKLRKYTDGGKMIRWK